MLNDTERLTKMRFVNLTIEFDKLRLHLWPSGLVSGMVRQKRDFSGRNKGQEVKGTSKRVV